MNICYFRQSFLDQLRASISSNLERYRSDEPWISDFFGHDGWYLQSRISCEDIVLQEPSGSREKFDLENVKRVYSALKHLKISQAVDERLWAYLTHVTFWKYMRRRWPAEDYEGKEDPARVIRERYFFMPYRDRALFRNGIARLWWYGYVSYDEQREDPFELTGVLLRNQDIAQQLVERSFSRNRDITKAVLSALRRMELEGRPLPSRDQFRDLMMHINRLGGVAVLDALTGEDIQQIVFRRLA